jgi:hypothetical protein
LGSGIFFGNWVGGQFGPNEGREHALLAEDSLVGQGPLGLEMHVSKRAGVGQLEVGERQVVRADACRPEPAGWALPASWPHYLQLERRRSCAFQSEEARDRDAYFSPFIWSEGFRTFVKRFLCLRNDTNVRDSAQMTDLRLAPIFNPLRLSGSADEEVSREGCS